MQTPETNGYDRPERVLSGARQVYGTAIAGAGAEDRLGRVLSGARNRPALQGDAGDGALQGDAGDGALQGDAGDGAQIPAAATPARVHATNNGYDRPERVLSGARQVYGTAIASAEDRPERVLSGARNRPALQGGAGDGAQIPAAVTPARARVAGIISTAGAGAGQNAGAKQKQGGSALLSVLLLFSLVMLIVTQVIAVNRKAISKTEYLFDGIRARQLLPLAESLAGRRLSHHLSTRGYDGGEVPGGGIGVGDGWSVSYKIVDLQSRINLNNVAFNANWRPVIENLVQEEKKKTVSRLIDWVDKDDSKVDIHGGEKALYKQQLRRRVIANRPMVHPSEFRHLHEVSDEVWYAIRDRVTALPAQTAVNVNSASAQTLDLLLVAYTNYPLLTGNSGGWINSEEFVTSPVMAGHNLFNNNQINITSNYWLYELEIKSPRRNYQFHSRVYQDANSGELRITDRFSGSYIAK